MSAKLDDLIARRNQMRARLEMHRTTETRADGTRVYRFDDPNIPANEKSYSVRLEELLRIIDEIDEAREAERADAGEEILTGAQLELARRVAAEEHRTIGGAAAITGVTRREIDLQAREMALAPAHPAETAVPIEEIVRNEIENEEGGDFASYVDLALRRMAAK